MAFEHLFFDVDFRNESINTQKDIIDTFFQSHTMEYWEVGENEVMFGTFDRNNLTGASRFTIFDAGEEGIKANITELNGNQNLINFVAANRIIKSIMKNDRIIFVQYVPRS